jgi:hypothetical protein
MIMETNIKFTNFRNVTPRRVFTGFKDFSNIKILRLPICDFSQERRVLPDDDT